MYDLKSSEIPIGGYTLILRAPTLHQHKAVVAAIGKLNIAPVWAAIQPAIDAAKADGAPGALMVRIAEALPVALRAFTNEILVNGIEVAIEASAVCLDNRGNHRRLREAPVDPDFDRAKGIGDPETGADGSTYLACEGLRTWLRANLTTDQAFWVLRETLALGGYAEMGKALASQIAGAVRQAAVAVPKPTAEATITA